MANIVIKELDLTTPSDAGTNNEVVYVPGFATNDEGAYSDFENRALQNNPILCSTVDEFNYYFGSYPAVFTEDLAWESTDFSENAKGSGNMFSKGTVDPSYGYAKELINAGVSVLYEKMNDDTSTTYSPSNMYTALKGSEEYDPYLNIADVGEYSVKYITSGGYPSFESGVALDANGMLVVGATTPSDYTIAITDDFYSTFTREIGQYTVKYSDDAPASYTVNKNTSTSTYQDILNVNIASATFVSADTIEDAVSTAGTHTFTWTATVSGQTVTWACSGDATIGGEITTAALGTTYGITGIQDSSVSNSDTIVIVVETSGGAGWYIEAYNDTAEPETFIGNLATVTSEANTSEIINGTAKSGIRIVHTGAIAPANNWVIKIELSSNISTNLAAKLLHCAATRGDAVALIDHTNNRDRALTGTTSVYYAASNASSQYRISANNEYGAMFTPWFVYTPVLGYASSNRKYNSVKSWFPSAMPGSFAYLMSLALSVRDNPSWLAIAGVTRGVVPNLVDIFTSKRLTNAIADSYQPNDKIAINPITNIRPYGYTIWGNRTLKDNAKKGGLTATSFLNIRNMLSDIKKQAYNAAVIGLFEQNNEILWLNFKSYIEPLLDQMTSGYGISDYSIIREPSDNPAKVVATIRIYPVYAVEMFEITVELSNSTLEVTE